MLIENLCIRSGISTQYQWVLKREYSFWCKSEQNMYWTSLLKRVYSWYPKTQESEFPQACVHTKMIWNNRTEILMSVLGPRPQPPPVPCSVLPPSASCTTYTCHHPLDIISHNAVGCILFAFWPFGHHHVNMTPVKLVLEFLLFFISCLHWYSIRYVKTKMSNLISIKLTTWERQPHPKNRKKN